MEQSLKVFNIIFFAIMICVNALGELLPLGVGSTGEISAKYPNLFTPAPMTFSIWGVIYVLVAIFSYYQLGLGSASSFAGYLVNSIGLWFIISCIMNIGWMISWHYEIIWLSLIFMLGLLISLIRLSTIFSGINDPTFLSKVSGVGFNIYLGWICAATIANISVLLVKIGWNGFGLTDQFWTAVALLLGTAIGILLIVTRGNYVAAAAIIWAYCGILVKHISQSGHAGAYPLVIGVALFGIAAILAICLVTFILSRKA